MSFIYCESLDGWIFFRTLTKKEPNSLLLSVTTKDVLCLISTRYHSSFTYSLKCFIFELHFNVKFVNWYFLLPIFRSIYFICGKTILTIKKSFKSKPPYRFFIYSAYLFQTLLYFRSLLCQPLNLILFST